MMSYHDPVLKNESIEGLQIKPTGVYVDMTYGGGGHSKAIIDLLDKKKGRLIAFDQDGDALKNRVDDERLIFANHNFRYMRNFVRYHGFHKVDGILADLGVSSHHFDSAERGFTFRENSRLDMRMNQNATLTAAKILNTYEVNNLKSIFSLYGELQNSYKVTSAIVKFRESKKIAMVDDLREALVGLIPARQEHKFLAKVFQALRVEVNKEMEVLRSAISQMPELVKPGGRISIISYHSLEDRLVKNFIKAGNFEGKAEKDFYGNLLSPFKAVHKKVIVPTDEEIERNNRARSAKLRIAERV